MPDSAILGNSQKQYYAGKFVDAKQVLFSFWELNKEKYGEDDEKTLQALLNLARLYEERQMYSTLRHIYMIFPDEVL